MTIAFIFSFLILTDRVCGDSFVSAIGSFSASELNGGYQGYSEDSGCTWAIFSDVDALAKLRLTQLYIEEMYIASSDICEENYLEVILFDQFNQLMYILSSTANATLCLNLNNNFRF